MDTTFGGRVALARERAKLTQAQLGRLVGAHRNAVNAWEADARLPDGGPMVRLPGALRVSGHWLLTGHGDMDLPTGNETALLKIAGKVVAGRLGEALVELLPTLRPALSADVAATVEQAARQWEQEQGPDDATGEGRG